MIYELISLFNFSSFVSLNYKRSEINYLHEGGIYSLVDKISILSLIIIQHLLSFKKHS